MSIKVQTKINSNLEFEVDLQEGVYCIDIQSRGKSLALTMLNSYLNGQGNLTSVYLNERLNSSNTNDIAAIRELCKDKDVILLDDADLYMHLYAQDGGLRRVLPLYNSKLTLIVTATPQYYGSAQNLKRCKTEFVDNKLILKEVTE